MRTALLAALCLVPPVHADVKPRLVSAKQVDKVEVNNCYSLQGEPKLRQVILWRNGRVVAWALASTCKISQLQNNCVLIHKGGNLVRVRFASWQETWTQFDPELEDRKHLPEHKREGWNR